MCLGSKSLQSPIGLHEPLHGTVTILAYLITLDLACHNFRAFNDPFNVGCDVRSEREIKRPWLTSAMQPGHDFIPSKQAELLVQTELCNQVSNANAMENAQKLHRVPLDNELSPGCWWP